MSLSLIPFAKMSQLESEVQSAQSSRSNVLQNKLNILKKSISISGQEFKRQSDQQEIDMEKRLEDIRQLISQLDVDIQKQTQHRCLSLANFKYEADDEMTATQKMQDDIIKELQDSLNKSRENQLERIKKLHGALLEENKTMEDELNEFYHISKERIEKLIAQVEENGKNYQIIFEYQNNFNAFFAVVIKKLQLEHSRRLNLIQEFQYGIEDNFAKKRQMLHEQGQKIESMFNELDEKISSNIRDRQEAYSMITENMDEILALVNDSVSNSKRSLGIQ